MSFTQGVEKRVLGNGLRVLVKEQRAAPVTAVVAHVRVGYFNEPDRLNGISHVIEHMLFKGTRKRPHKEQIASDVRAIGGSINAGTYYEDTSYYITVPSRHTESAIEILSDMLRNSLIDPEELAKELEVIIQESKQKRDNPRAMLFETMYAKAFDRHRIRRWRIGEDETLRGFRSEDLAEFIARTYTPENIVVSIVGDTDSAAAHTLVDRHWGDLAARSTQSEESPAESKRTGFRYHRMRGDIQQRHLVFGFPAPPLMDPLAPALMILDSVLSDGRSSRFYRSLKEDQRLVNSASASYEGFERLGIFTFSAEAQENDPIDAEKGLFGEVSKLISDGVRDEELQRIKTRLDSRWVFAQEEATGLARTLSTYEMLGGYALADALRARLDVVSSGDVVEAAVRTVDLRSSTLVEYLPESGEAPVRSAESVYTVLAAHTAAHPDSTSADRSPSHVPAATAFGSTGECAESDLALTQLDGGAALLHRRRSDLPVVAVHVLFPGGRLGETPQSAGITNLMLKSSLKGAGSSNAAELAERIESLGSSIGLTLASDYLGYSMKLLKPVAREGLSILKDIVCWPSFPPDEIAKEKDSVYAEIRRQKDSMFSRAMDLFNQARFGNHPYGLPASGDECAVADLSESDIRDWSRMWIGSSEAVVSVVGDLSLHETQDLFADFLPVTRAHPQPTEVIIPDTALIRADYVERHQTASVMGFDGASIHSADRYALDLIAEMASGLAGRFFQAVRGDNALAYAVTSFHRSRGSLGIFGTYTATSPENEDAARNIILRECARLASEPIPAEELRDAKAAIRGEYAIHNQTFGSQAAESAVNYIYGLPLNAPAEYLARLDAVTSDEITDVAARYLNLNRYWVGVVRGTPDNGRNSSD